jgi:hypothetical protein
VLHTFIEAGRSWVYDEFDQRTDLAEEDDARFELTAEQEAELARRIQSVESGQFVDRDELLGELSRE